MKNQTTILVVTILLLGLASCAPEGYTSDPCGFFSGIGHGIVFPFALIGKLLSMDIGIVAEHNTGFTYWLGFIIGLGGLGGGAAAR